MLHVRKVCEMIFVLSVPAHTHILGRTLSDHRMQAIIDNLAGKNKDYLVRRYMDDDGGFRIGNHDADDILAALTRMYESACKWVHSSVPYTHSSSHVSATQTLMTFQTFLPNLLRKHCFKIEDYYIFVEAPFWADHKFVFKQGRMVDGQMRFLGEPISVSVPRPSNSPA
jgi:hypothetical protein